MGRIPSTSNCISLSTVRNIAGLAALLIVLLNLFRGQLSGTIRYAAQHTFSKVSQAPLNETLGFDKIAVVSTGTSWRLDGLIKAANYTNLHLDIPFQPAWSEREVDNFRGYGTANRHTEIGPGQAQCWLGHLNVWREIMLQKWSTVLIMEDDADWDIAIKEQLFHIAPLIREVTSASKNGTASQGSPYGDTWDLLWLGHCGDYIPRSSVSSKEPPALASFTDRTLPDSPMYRENDGRFTEFPSHLRMVHMSVGPICTYSYALTSSAASKIYDLSKSGMDKIITTHLREWCQEGTLRCVTVNPELFHHHKQAGEVSSEIATVEGWDDLAAKMKVDFTANIRFSARCSSQLGRTVACQSEFGDGSNV